ncbi:hypothetical protein PROFUN_02174 [Planoprotostelium fungivorum]|uniref:Calcineurin-like phosphoesterase domain-containing protein n=1 Tax=Planoprotostelium fungivorum TaxID=1890364 RepID=A0A2P6NZC8_9EUKA|nr:hypothetical protein PROFUN_02174 [Planoprotostelium fungivorum]
MVVQLCRGHVTTSVEKAIRIYGRACTDGVMKAFLNQFYKLLLFVGILLAISIAYVYAYIPLSGLPLVLSGEPSIRLLLVADPQMEGDSRINREGPLLGQLNLNINDYFGRHVFLSAMSSLQPTHVAVLGDLFSNQYLSDAEFASRLARYNWMFEHPLISSGKTQLINITGNHDIGYASEINSYQISKFEKAFGAVNDRYEASGHILGIFNSMNVDTSSDQRLSESTWNHMKELAEERKKGKPLILLTHVPLYKPRGSCVDGPDIHRNNRGAVTEQNVISEESSRWILDEMKPAIILNGHDHYGCKYTHEGGIREYTVRSVMGDFSGYTAVVDVVETGGQYEYVYHDVPFVSVYSIIALAITLLIWFSSLFLYLLLRHLSKEGERRKEASVVAPGPFGRLHLLYRRKITLPWNNPNAGSDHTFTRPPPPGIGGCGGSLPMKLDRPTVGKGFVRLRYKPQPETQNRSHEEMPSSITIRSTANCSPTMKKMDTITRMTKRPTMKRPVARRLFDVEIDGEALLASLRRENEAVERKFFERYQIEFSEVFSSPSSCGLEVGWQLMIANMDMQYSSSMELSSQGVIVVGRAFQKCQEYEKEMKSLKQKKNSLDPQINNLRLLIKNIYKQIIITDLDFAMEKDIEVGLWRTAFYQVIEEYRRRIRKLTQPRTSELNGQLAKYCERFNSFIDQSVSFYHELMNELQQKHNLILDGTVDYRANGSNNKSYISCHRCLVFLGDLHRYKRDLIDLPQQQEWTLAATFYQRALYLIPDFGNPHNQLAVLATHAEENFAAIYQYFRSITILNPFPTAKDNLHLLFEMNKTREEQAKNLESLDRHMLCKFTYLHGILYEKTGFERFSSLCGETSQLLSQWCTSTLSVVTSSNQMDVNPFAECTLRMVAINISSTHNVLQASGNSYSEMSQKSAQLTYSLLVSLLTFERLMSFISSLFDRIVDGRTSSQILAGITVFMDYLVTKPELTRHVASQRDTPSEHRDIVQHTLRMTNSAKIHAKSPVHFEEISLKEEVELRGFLPLEKYRNLIFRDFSARSLSAEEEQSHTLKRLDKIKHFASFLCNDVGEGNKPFLYYDEESRTYNDKPTRRETFILQMRSKSTPENSQNKPDVERPSEISEKFTNTPTKVNVDTMVKEPDLQPAKTGSNFEEEEGDLLLDTLNSLQPLEENSTYVRTNNQAVVDESDDLEDEIIVYQPREVSQRVIHHNTLPPPKSIASPTKIPPPTHSMNAIGSERTSSPPFPVPDLHSILSHQPMNHSFLFGSSHYNGQPSPKDHPYTNSNGNPNEFSHHNQYGPMAPALFPAPPPPGSAIYNQPTSWSPIGGNISPRYQQQEHTSFFGSQGPLSWLPQGHSGNMPRGSVHTYAPLPQLPFPYPGGSSPAEVSPRNGGVQNHRNNNSFVS